jgi:hypothetical protein
MQQLPHFLVEQLDDELLALDELSPTMGTA